MTEEQKADCLSRLTITGDMNAAADADMVIEAIKEDPEIKMKAFAQLSDICREDTIISSNTSAISISKLSAAVKNHGRFQGTHFFNPVPAMKLIEIVEDITTTPETNAAVTAGLPDSVPGITVHRDCTSSMSSVQLGYYQIKSGEAA